MRPLAVKPFHLLAAAFTAVAALLLANPGHALESAVRGMIIWWDVLFPALFPFFLLSEMMLGFGIVHFFGTLLDPLMRPLFRLPGIGGFVMAMGFASGYPVGARLTAQLWEQKLVTREEGERLVSFTTSSDPIFLIGAVAVGFFGDVKIAVVLAAAHYGAALILGFLMRFHGRKAVSTSVRDPEPGTLLRRSFRAMHNARLRDGRPIGQLLQDSVGSALQLIFVIGGLVVFFSAFMAMLDRSGMLGELARGAGLLLSTVGLHTSLTDSLVNGLFEVTLGAKAAGQAGAVPLMHKAAAAAFVLSWGGLSVHAQVVSLLHRTDLRYMPFFLARIGHSVLAAVLVLLLWPVLSPENDTGTAAYTGPLHAFASQSPVALEWKYAAAASLTALAFILAAFLVLQTLHWISKKLYNRLEKM